ncbi:MAG TPA: phosphoribosylformylglycinamidine cyclo-ligase [Thermoleophilaceae bacterium]|nr:phosphoribosylformylglycinamidine cyclo-ligase [Thermoleophilaceae bacterium]
MAEGAYAESGVDTGQSDAAVRALVSVLGTIDTGRPRRAVMGSGHYANVLRLDETTGLALSTDGVGSKVIVAEQLARFDTVGIDCIAMNVNDLICVGAEPIALVDYIAVEQADPDMLAQVAEGLKAGAEQAGIEIPGGELAQLPEVIRGHPSPTGFDLVGACVGLVKLDAIVTGDRVEPGDAIVGIPSSGLHSNGYTLARRALPDLHEAFGDGTVGDALIEPTRIYVREVVGLLRSEVDVRGLAHITGDGFLNLGRLEAAVGYRITDALPPHPIFGLIAERGETPPEEMYEVFNMGCGLCCVVPADDAEQAATALAGQVIGEVTDRAGVIEVAGLEGRRGEGFRPAPTASR